MGVLHTHNNQEVVMQGCKAFAITPSDTNNIDFTGAALYCNEDMTVALVLMDDTDDTGNIFKLSKGYHPLKVKKVLSTGTNLGGESLFGLK